MVTAEIVTSGVNYGSWMGISIFLFAMWTSMIIFYQGKIKENQKLRKSIKKLKEKLKK